MFRQSFSFRAWVRSGLFAMIFCVAYLANGQFKTGLIADTTDISLVKRVNLDIKHSKLPASVSLLPYAPVIGEQEEGSCVSWAMAYCALTIAK